MGIAVFPEVSGRGWFTFVEATVSICAREPASMAREGQGTMHGFWFTVPHSQTLRQLGSIVFAALFLAACSSGGGDGGGGTSPAASSSSSGTFVDSPVQGLGYRALPSGIIGKTDATGQYQYMPGDMVSFDIYGRPIGGAVAAGPVVTALSVFNATSITDPRVLNLSQLLLTLGGIPAAGAPIRMPSTPPGRFPAVIDFSAPGFDTAFPGLVSEATATTHLQANFSTLSVTMAGSGSVASNPTGLNCGATCSADFLNGTSVTVTPTGAGFIGWGGGCMGPGACVVTLNTNTAVSATFTSVPTNANLTVTTAGNGTGSVTSSPPGLDCGATCSALFVQGTVVLTANAANGSTFAGWNHGTGNATNCPGTSTCSIPLTVDSTVIATFTPNAVPVSVIANIASGNGGGGTVTCSADNGPGGSCASYLPGTDIVMTATPDSVSNFSGWSGAGCSGTGLCSFTLTDNTMVTANFNRPRLTVMVNGTGSVSSNPAGINTCTANCSASFDKGTVTLTAMADLGSTFAGWSGGCSGPSPTCLVNLTADTAVTASFDSTPTGVVYPLTIDPTSRHYLVDRNGAAFPILGRTAWFITSLSETDYKMFIDDTAAKGYNAIEFHVVNHDPRGNHPPFDGTGALPFSKRLDGSAWTGSNWNDLLSYVDPSTEAPDFTQPNETYWTHVDALLAYAESKGMLCFMFPAYVGFAGGSQGWMVEMVANGPTKMEAYGAWIATRYKNQKNLVWMAGGDLMTFDANQKPVESALLTGLQSVANQQSIYFSAEWTRGSIATDQVDFGSQMTLNGTYANSRGINIQGRRAYIRSPTMPAFLLEEPYDEEGSDGNSVNSDATQPVRRFQWWGWLSNIGGYISGNGYIWPFNAVPNLPSKDDWRLHLNTQGAQDMARLNAFIRSIAWYNLVPSGLGGMGTLVIGNSSLDLIDYVASAATPDGTVLVVYVPPAHSGPITIDMTVMSGLTRARWFNPTTAAYVDAGAGLPALGTMTFTPPGDNGTGFSDWVLLLEKQ